MALEAFSRFWQTRLSRLGGVERFTEWRAPRYGEIDEHLHIVTQGELGRPDLISFKHYQRTDLWWAILDYNDLADAFSLQPGDRLFIPDLASVEAVIATQRANPPPSTDDVTDLEESNLVPVLTYTQPTIVPFTNFLVPAEQATQADPINIENEQLFMVVPDNLSGAQHFQLQISPDPGFTFILFSRLTHADRTGWSYQSATDDSVYTAYPAGGINGVIQAGRKVRFQLPDGHPLSPGIRYYLRYRAWSQQLEGAWHTNL